MEELVVFIVGEGNQDTVLVGDLRDLFGYVNVFPMSYLPSVLTVASPAAYCITRDHSQKNDMDNVLELPGVGQVTRPRSRVWLDLADSIDPLTEIMAFSTNSRRCSSFTRSSI